MRWGMAIELKRRIGCNTSVLACKAGYFFPLGNVRNWVLVGERGE
jgi:Fe-S-cluster-containing dehydrogenase component